MPQRHLVPKLFAALLRHFRCCLIYFPRDFRLFPSASSVADVTMQENVATYKATNPFWESSSGPLSTKPSSPQAKCKPDFDVEEDYEAEAHLNLALAYQHVGQIGQARAEYATACKLEAKFCGVTPR